MFNRLSLFLKSLPQFLQGIASVICGYVMSYIIMEFDDGSSMVEIGYAFVIAGSICLLIWMGDVLVGLLKEEYCDPLHWICIGVALLIMMCFLIVIFIVFETIVFGIIFAIIWLFVSLVPNGFIIFLDRR